MGKRLWLNLGLLALAVGLGLLVWLEPGKTPPPGPPALTALQAEQIDHILLQRPTGPDIELARQDGQWWMLKPYHLPANTFRVESLLRLVSAESLSQHDLTGLLPASYGLDKPRARVTFNHTVEIAFGGTAPLQQRRYVRIGNTLHTILDTYYYQVAGKPTLFLSHALLPPAAKITRLRLPELELRLVDGRWQRTPPHPERSADASVELVNAWRHAQAIELREGSAPKGKAEVAITLAGQTEPLRFRRLKQNDDILLIRMDNGLRYVISEAIEKQLFRLPEDHRDEGQGASDEAA